MDEDGGYLKLDFQVGTSPKAWRIMGLLAGRVEGEDGEDSKSKKENRKAPFERMSDAYLFAMILGLSLGEKETVSKRKNFANFSSIEGDHDISTILRTLGKPEDYKSKDSAKQAIEEYATWGLLHIHDNYIIGDDDYRFGSLFGDD